MAIRHFIAPAGDSTGPASPSRRQFMGISAGLMVGFWLIPEEVLAASDATAAYHPNAFVVIGADNRITLIVPKVEMGQGIYTAIPMLIAEELEVDISKLVLEHAPPDAKVYGIPFGDQFTGGSTSIRTLWGPMRQSGAAARMVLVQAAAQRWGVPAESCHAELGTVIHAASGRKLSYGELVEDAAKLPLPEKIALKPASEFKLIGKPVKRLDAKGKVDGSAKYGMDTILPGMLYASVVTCPVFGGKVKSVDDSKARALRGVKQVVKLDNAVAVLAENTWYARQGVAALEIAWDEGPNAAFNTDDMRKLMVAALAKPGVVARNDGDALGQIAQGGNTVQRHYQNPMLAHATMEGMNCTVHVKDGSAEIWTGTQVPARAQAAAAKVLGLPQDKVTVHGFLLGGGFGRRLEVDYVEQAAAIAKHVQEPVKMVWTREEDIRHDIFRGYYAHTVTATVDDKGYPVALSHKYAGPSIIARWAPGFLKDGVLDTDAADGSMNCLYGIPHFRSEYVREEGPVMTGFWRGVGPTRNVLVLETFIDELAARAHKDPLEYRLALLDQQPRAQHVLRRAAALAGWGKPMPAGMGRGIALMPAWDTFVAQVVDLKVSAEGEVTVQRVVCVVDCGMVVNPNTVAAQMESGIIYGLTAARYGAITLKDGRVEQSNFHDYPMLRMNESPKIEVEIVKSSEYPGGIGEPATAAIGPAVVNAIYAATGKRVYELPATPDRLKEAKAA